EFLAAFQKMVTQTQEIDWAKILTETSGQTLASTTKMGTPQHTLSRHTLVNTASECEDCETDIEDEVERKKKNLVVPHVTIKSHRKKH
ncbi:MAG: hypothetical protein KDC44_03365, partial [Phaeodactylibacter sp.]|nr:hypothetical protein [Phaeodactylibacter sp.]